MIKTNRLKRFGRRNMTNAIAVMQLLLGLYFSISTVSKYFENENIGFPFTSAIVWYVVSFYSFRHYVSLSEKHIFMYNFNSIKLQNIESVEFSDNAVLINSAKKKLKIYYADLQNDREPFISEIKKISMGKNSSKTPLSPG